MIAGHWLEGKLEQRESDEKWDNDGVRGFIGVEDLMDQTVRPKMG